LIISKGQLQLLLFLLSLISLINKFEKYCGSHYNNLSQMNQGLAEKYFAKHRDYKSAKDRQIKVYLFM